MSSNKAIQSLDKIFSRIKSTLKDAEKPKSLIPTAKFAIDVIVKRTRLGYGVARQFGVKTKLKPLSKGYIKKRENYGQLFSLTAPRRSNLTFTGQMLESMDIIRAVDGKITIGPTGTRDGDGKLNLKIAGWQEEQGRIFNRISQLEYIQVLRFYRRTFTDLLKKIR